jgi:hypothetical protein
MRRRSAARSPPVHYNVDLRPFRLPSQRTRPRRPATAIRHCSHAPDPELFGQHLNDSRYPEVRRQFRSGRHYRVIGHTDWSRADNIVDGLSDTEIRLRAGRYHKISSGGSIRPAEDPGGDEALTGIGMRLRQARSQFDADRASQHVEDSRPCVKNALGTESD